VLNKDDCRKLEYLVQTSNSFFIMEDEERHCDLSLLQVDIGRHVAELTEAVVREVRAFQQQCSLQGDSKAIGMVSSLDEQILALNAEADIGKIYYNILRVAWINLVRSVCLGTRKKRCVSRQLLIYALDSAAI
jgi:hypothetical protein